MEALVERLKDPDGAVRNAAGEAINHDHRLQALPYLLRLCKDDSPDARHRAFCLMPNHAELELLAYLGAGAMTNQVAEVCLAALRNDPSPIVRRAAASRLEDCPLDLNASLPTLLLAVDDSDSGVRRHIAQILGDLPGREQGEEEIVKAMIALLHDPEADVRAAAANQLRGPRFAAEKIFPALIGALSDDDGHVRLTAVFALGRFGPDAKAAIPRLLPLLNDEELARAATYTLVKIGGDAVPALAEALTNGEERARLSAAIALESLGPDAKGALPHLRKAIGDSNRLVRKHAAAALKAIDPELAKKLLVS
jgi:HEAT repeat protein